MLTIRYPIFIIFLLGHFSALAQKPITLVIDPGHGGRDPGKPRGSIKRAHEKDINLSISLKMGKYIQENLPHVKVLYTRNKDVYVSLEDRANFANENKADYFISIHANSSPNRHTSGTETHVYSTKQAASYRLADIIQKEFKTRAARKSRGIIDAIRRGHNLYVTQYTQMPSVLVEVGYLSNEKEERYLNDKQGQVIIASALYRAFRGFLQSNPPPENRSLVYKVQIMASPEPVELDADVFEKLDEKVVELVNPKAPKYPYKYMVGREYDIERARYLARRIAKLGYTGAFVVKLEE